MANIQPPKSASIAKIVSIFGRNVSVCSCIEVVAWKIATISPIINAENKIGATKIKTCKMPERIKFIICPKPMFAYLKTEMKSCRVKIPQPSTSTKSISLNGMEIWTGGSIIIPIDMRMLATTMSIMMNGMYR